MKCHECQPVQLVVTVDTNVLATVMPRRQACWRSSRASRSAPPFRAGKQRELRAYVRGRARGSRAL